MIVFSITQWRNQEIFQGRKYGRGKLRRREGKVSDVENEMHINLSRIRQRGVNVLSERLRNAS